MSTLKARKRRVRRRSAKKRVKRTKGKKKRSRRRTYKGGMFGSSNLKKKWEKHMKLSYRNSKGLMANNNCNLLPLYGYHKWIRNNFPDADENKVVQPWGNAMHKAASEECEKNASNETPADNPVSTSNNELKMENKNVGAPVVNDDGELISGIKPMKIPENYVTGGRRKSRRRRRKKSKQSKKRRRRKR